MEGTSHPLLWPPTIVAGLGAALVLLDQWLLDREKSRVREAVLSLWVTLGDSDWSRVSALAANGYFWVAEHIFGNIRAIPGIFAVMFFVLWVLAAVTVGPDIWAAIRTEWRILGPIYVAYGAVATAMLFFCSRIAVLVRNRVGGIRGILGTIAIQLFVAIVVGVTICLLVFVFAKLLESVGVMSWIIKFTTPGQITENMIACVLLALLLSLFVLILLLIALILSRASERVLKPTSLFLLDRLYGLNRTIVTVLGATLIAIGGMMGWLSLK